MIYTQSYAYIQINKLKHTKYVHTCGRPRCILTGILASTSQPSLANKSHHQNSQDICKQFCIFCLIYLTWSKFKVQMNFNIANGQFQSWKKACLERMSLATLHDERDLLCASEPVQQKSTNKSKPWIAKDNWHSQIGGEILKLFINPSYTSVLSWSSSITTMAQCGAPTFPLA